MNISNKIYNVDWRQKAESLDANGYCMVEKLVSPGECAALIDLYGDASLYRKTVDMERYRFGRGEYKYFQYPLPPLIQELRTGIYPHLAPVANRWMQQLRIEKQFPGQLNELLEVCREADQTRPTPLILKYGPGGYNTLHQDLYGDVYFPMQAVVFLNEPGEDFTGGEFLLIEQRLRAQSRAIVLTPGKGDMLIFTTNFKPAKGSNGFYRLNMRHGVSEVTGGARHTLGIIFHDAA
jgi:hypothetical protein